MCISNSNVKLICSENITCERGTFELSVEFDLSMKDDVRRCKDLANNTIHISRNTRMKEYVSIQPSFLSNSYVYLLFTRWVPAYTRFVTSPTPWLQEWNNTTRCMLLFRSQTVGTLHVKRAEIYSVTPAIKVSRRCMHQVAPENVTF